MFYPISFIPICENSKNIEIFWQKMIIREWWATGVFASSRKAITHSEVGVMATFIGFLVLLADCLPDKLLFWNQQETSQTHRLSHPWQQWNSLQAISLIFHLVVIKIDGLHIRHRMTAFSVLFDYFTAVFLWLRIKQYGFLVMVSFIKLHWNNSFTHFYQLFLLIITSLHSFMTLKPHSLIILRFWVLSLLKSRQRSSLSFSISAHN